MGQTGSTLSTTAETPSSSSDAIVGPPPDDNNACENVNEGHSIRSESSLPNNVRRKSALDFDDSRVVGFLQSIGLVSSEKPCPCLQDHQHQSSPYKRHAIQSLLNQLDVSTTAVSPKKIDDDKLAQNLAEHDEVVHSHLHGDVIKSDSKPESDELQAMYEAVGKSLASRLSHSAREKVVGKLKEILEESQLEEETHADFVVVNSKMEEHSEIKPTQDDVILETATESDNVNIKVTEEGESEGVGESVAAEESSSTSTPELAEDTADHYIIEAIKYYLGIGIKKQTDETTKMQTNDENEEPGSGPEDVSAGSHTVKTLKHIVMESLNRNDASASNNKCCCSKSDHAAKEVTSAPEAATIATTEAVQKNEIPEQIDAGEEQTQGKQNMIESCDDVSNGEQADNSVIDGNDEKADRSEQVVDLDVTTVQESAAKTDTVDIIQQEQVEQQSQGMADRDSVAQEIFQQDAATETDSVQNNEITEPDSTAVVGSEAKNGDCTDGASISENTKEVVVHFNETVERFEQVCQPIARQEDRMRDAVDSEQTDIIQTIKNFFGLGKKKQRKRKVRKEMCDSNVQTDEVPTGEQANDAAEVAELAVQNTSACRADRPKLRLQIPTGDGTTNMPRRHATPNTTYLRSPRFNYPNNMLNITPKLRVNHRGNIIDAIHSPANTPYVRTPTTRQSSSPWTWTPGTNDQKTPNRGPSPIVRNIAGTPLHGFTWSRKSDGTWTEDAEPPSLPSTPNSTIDCNNFLHPTDCTALRNPGTFASPRPVQSRTKHHLNEILNIPDQRSTKASPKSAQRTTSPRQVLKPLPSNSPSTLASPMLRQKSRNDASPSPRGTQKMMNKGTTVNVLHDENVQKMRGTRNVLVKRRGSRNSPRNRHHDIEQASNVRLIRD